MNSAGCISTPWHGIVPSVAYETFGLVVIEAFARKTPAIVRDLGALPEVIQKVVADSSTAPTRSCLPPSAALLVAAAARRAWREGVSRLPRTWSTETHLNRYFSLLRKVATRKFGFVPWEDQGSVDHAATLP